MRRDAATACCSPRSTMSRRASRARSTGCSSCSASCRRPHRDARRAQSLGRRADRPRLALRGAAAGAGRTPGFEMFLHGFFHRDDAGTTGVADRIRARLDDRRRRRVPRPRRATEAAERIARRTSADRRHHRPADRRLRRARLALRPGRASRRWRIARSRSPRIICASGRRRPARRSLADRSSPGRAARGCASRRRSPPRRRCVTRRSTCFASACIRPTAAIRA